MQQIPGKSTPRQPAERVSVTCPVCGISRLVSKWTVKKYPRCRPCGFKAAFDARGRRTEQQKREQQRKHYLANKSVRDAYSLAWRDKQRLAVIQKLGGKCRDCGISDPIVLAIDHVENDGAHERRIFKKSTAGWLSKILRDELPLSRYQVLCYNCNWRKEYFRRKNDASVKVSSSTQIDGSNCPRLEEAGRRWSIEESR